MGSPITGGQLPAGDRSRGECLTVALGEGRGHPVQEVGGEDGGVPAAGGVDDLLAAGEVGLKAAAEKLHLLAGGLTSLLLDQPQPRLVLRGALLVLRLDALHAGGVSEVESLVGTLPTHLLYYLDNSFNILDYSRLSVPVCPCTAVEHVEVVPLVTVQAPH